MFFSARLVSTLLIATRIGLPLARSFCATSRSSGTTPSCTLTTKMMAFAASMAISTCSSAALTMTSSDFSRRSRPMPPVSTSENDFPFHSASTLTRSRVTPGWSWTMAMRRLTMRLNSADFPTFGRPTMAMRFDTGTLCRIFRGHERRNVSAFGEYSPTIKSQFPHQTFRAPDPHAVAFALERRRMHIVAQDIPELGAGEIGLIFYDVKFGQLNLGAWVGMALRDMLPILQ